jgi:hypothetical protein
MGARMSNETESESGEDEFVIRLEDGSLLGSAISGLQKMIRRGMEAEALVLALGMLDSGYGLALARRLPIIAAEDLGLASPEAVAQACTLCITWIALRKEQKHQPDGLPLAMAVMLLCRSAKNREVDNAGVVIREEQKRQAGDKPHDIIERYHELIVDSHTPRGKQRLRKIAEERNVPYEQLAWEDFYQTGAQLEPLKQIDGDRWSHRAYALFGLDYEAELRKGKKTQHEKQ